MAHSSKSIDDLKDDAFENISELNTQTGGESSVSSESIELQETCLDDVIDEILESPENHPIPDTSRQLSQTEEVRDKNGDDANSEESSTTGLFREFDAVLNDEPKNSSEMSKQQKKEAVKQPIGDEVNDEGTKYHGERRRSSFGFHDGSTENVSLLLFQHEIPKNGSLGNYTVIQNGLLDNHNGEDVRADKSRQNAETQDGDDEEEPGNESGKNGRVDGKSEIPKMKYKCENKLRLPEDSDVATGKFQERKKERLDDVNPEGIKMTQTDGKGERENTAGDSEEKNGISEDRNAEEKEEIANNVKPVGKGRSLSDDGAKNIEDQSELGKNNDVIGSNCNVVYDQDDGNAVIAAPGNQDEEIGVQDVIENIPEDDAVLPENHNDYTYIESWSEFAMGLGVNSYSVVSNGLSSETQSNVWNKVTWGASSFVSLIEMANMIPKSINTFKGKSTPNSLLKLGGFFALVIMLCIFWRATLAKEKHLLRANDRVLYSSLNKGKISKKGKRTFLTIMTIFVLANTSLFILHNTIKEANDFEHATIQDTVNMLECHGQEAITWNVKNCRQSPYLSTSNILWGMVGLVIMSHSVVVETVIVLGIITFSVVFFMATLETRKNQSEGENGNIEANTVTEVDHANLSEIAEELSKFIGECILAYLMLHLLQTPAMIESLFLGSIIVFISVIIKQGAIFVGLIAAALSSLWMKKIGEKLARRETGHQRLVGSARVRAFVSEMLFKKSIGLGLPGVFVITFAFLFSYIGLLATTFTALV